MNGKTVSGTQAAAKPQRIPSSVANQSGAEDGNVEEKVALVTGAARDLAGSAPESAGAKVIAMLLSFGVKGRFFGEPGILCRRPLL